MIDIVIKTGNLRTVPMECYGDDTHITFYDTPLSFLLILLVYVSKFNVHDTPIILSLRLALWSEPVCIWAGSERCSLLMNLMFCRTLWMLALPSIKSSHSRTQDAREAQHREDCRRRTPRSRKAPVSWLSIDANGLGKDYRGALGHK